MQAARQASPCAGLEESKGVVVGPSRSAMIPAQPCSTLSHTHAPSSPPPPTHTHCQATNQTGGARVACQLHAMRMQSCTPSSRRRCPDGSPHKARQSQVLTVNKEPCTCTSSTATVVQDGPRTPSGLVAAWQYRLAAAASKCRQCAVQLSQV
jgi:hypothetical protein